MDYQEKYLKYKIKYLKLKSQKKQILGTSNVSLLGGSLERQSHSNSINSNKKQENTLYLFKANWCYHCKEFKSTWDYLQETISDKINFVTFDADEDAKMIKEYKIEGFPTLILKSKNKAIEYVGPRDFNSIKEFIDVYN